MACGHREPIRHAGRGGRRRHSFDGGGRRAPHGEDAGGDCRWDVQSLRARSRTPGTPRRNHWRPGSLGNLAPRCRTRQRSHLPEQRQHRRLSAHGVAAHQGAAARIAAADRLIAGGNGAHGSGWGTSRLVSAWIGRSSFVEVRSLSSATVRIEVEGLHLGRRRTLTEGKLSLYVAPNLGRADALALPLRAFLGRLKHHQKFEEWCGTTITLDTSQREIRVALDGEINRIETPLRFSLMPRALRTIVPLEYGTRPAWAGLSVRRADADCGPPLGSALRPHR